MCDSRDAILAALGASYSESPTERGLSKDGDVMIEVLTAEDGKTWTIIITKPDGKSCLIAAGTDWQIGKWERPVTAEQPL